MDDVRFIFCFLILATKFYCVLLLIFISKRRATPDECLKLMIKKKLKRLVEIRVKTLYKKTPSKGPIIKCS